MLPWYASPTKTLLDLVNAQFMAKLSAAQVGEMANMASEIQGKDQVRKMLTWLQVFLSAYIRYPASIGANQNSVD